MEKFIITTNNYIKEIYALSFGQAELIFAKYGNPSNIIKIERSLNNKNNDKK